MKSASKLGLLVLLPFVACACQSGGGDDITPTSTHKWTWASGSNTANQKGTYGSLATASPTNVPGAREEALSWLDSSGRFWLFGGYGYDSVGFRGRLNDLWSYDPVTAVWTWGSGSQ